MRSLLPLAVVVLGGCPRDARPPTSAGPADAPRNAAPAVPPPVAAAAPVDAAPHADDPAPPADRPPCATKDYRAPAGAKVELLAHQAAGGGAVAEVGLHNAGTAPVCVWTHVATHEVQSDWLVIQYADGDRYHHLSRVVALNDDRDKSAPVSVELQPGETIWQRWDVAAWALRDRNGAEAIASGSLYAEAVYDTTGDTWAWAGRRQAQFELVAP
ncbi:MAG: hypothetical protein H6709_00150 [Kofleriaceae bacterium]|nr:hypothetical protein [Kofleriaceae bacterium]MCB9570477.1 hypothetical protein [Kofleriaceae bacterium]